METSGRTLIHRLGVLLFAIMLMTAGCGSGDEATEGATSQPATTEPMGTAATVEPSAGSTTSAPVAVTPNPLAVSVETDAGSAVTAFIPTDGGSVRAVAADGTVLALSIPAGALLSPQDVTLTPVADVNGLPLSGGLAAAADISPDGLQLQEPATLTIEPADPQTGDLSVGFAYHGDGAEFHLYPAAFDDNTITVQLSHFSGYGAGAGTAADIAGQLERVPTAPGDQANQAIASAIAQSGATAGQSLPAAAQSSVEDTLRQWWDQSVRPRLDNAQGDATQLDDAITEYLDWRAAVQMAVLTSAFVDEDIEARDMLTFGIANGIDEFAMQCLQQDAPENVVFIARWWNVADNLGLQIGYSVQQISAIIKACAAFVLDFDSSLTLAAGPVSGTFEVTATVALVLDPSLDYWTGAGPLTYTNVDFLLPPIPPNCVITQIDGFGSTFTVPFAWLNLDILSGPPDLRVVIDPGRPYEVLSAQCTDPDSGQTFTDALEFDGWVGNFALMHTSEFNVDATGLESGIRITGFSTSSQSHMRFVKSYAEQLTPAGVLIDEVTSIEVFPG
jgi:hypothetical protein